MSIFTRQNAIRVASLVLFSFGAVGLMGCGDDAPVEKKKTLADLIPADILAARAAQSSARSTGGKLSNAVVIPVRNDRWDAIEPHFKRFLSQKHTSPKDVTKTKILTFIPRPVAKPKAQVEVEVVDVEAEEVGPLQQYPLDQYSLLMIMSGTALPKAVVVDPKGQAFVIQRDTRLGDKGGIVDSITQYMVVVKEPNEEEPVKIAIRPPYVDLATQAGFDPEEYQMSDDDFAAPPAAVRDERGTE